MAVNLNLVFGSHSILSVMTSGARKLQELATQKEQELHKIREEHYRALETSLKSCEEELEREKEKRKALEDDFRYNLTLIEQRDHELARYDAIFQELKKVFYLINRYYTSIHNLSDRLSIVV